MLAINLDVFQIDLSTFTAKSDYKYSEFFSCWRLTRKHAAFCCFCPQRAAGAAVRSSPELKRSQAVRPPVCSRPRPSQMESDWRRAPHHACATPLLHPWFAELVTRKIKDVLNLAFQIITTTFHCVAAALRTFGKY